MKKNVFGRKLKRDTKERKALFKSLLSSLVLKERIKTTEAKAKAIKKDAEKLISKARKEEKLAKKLLSAHLTPQAIKKLITEIAPRFENKKGGYTRILKLGERLSDNAKMAIIEWVEKGSKAVLESADEVLRNKSQKKELKKNPPKNKSKKTSSPKKMKETGKGRKKQK